MDRGQLDKGLKLDEQYGLERFYIIYYHYYCSKYSDLVG